MAKRASSASAVTGVQKRRKLSSASDATPPVESPEDFGEGPSGEAARWLAEITLFESENKDTFMRFEKIIKRYRNESWRDDIPAATGADARGRGFALFWANVETLKPVIYAHPPKADVQRRWKDKDPVARVASEVLERCLDYFIDNPNFTESTKSCRDDYLIVGQGVQWHRYVPHFHDVKLRIPARKVVGRGDGNEEMTDTTGHGVPDQGLQITNNSDSAEYDENEAYEAPDSEGNYAPVNGETVEHDEEGPFIMRAQQEIRSEEVVQDYVYWRDFGWTPGARTWAEVYCVWRKVYMTRDELIDRFGEDVGKAVRLDYAGPKSQGQDSFKSKQQFYKKATIYEIWDKTTKKVHWLAKEYDGDLLDSRPDPLQITGFFPCQKPIFATQTNGQVSPVPDYLQYQDQAMELDRLTQRLYVMMDALQVKFLYAGNSEALQNLLQNAGELDGTPVTTDILALLNGDISKSVWFWPIDTIVAAVNELLSARERVKMDSYEVTGISDIIRGATDPNETATAQQLKAQTGAVRVRDRQTDFANFVRNGLRIDSEIIVNHFQPDTIAQICDLKTIPEANHVMGPNGQWMDPAELQQLMQQQQQAIQQNPGGMPATAPIPGGQVQPQAPGLTGSGIPPGAPMMGHNGGPAGPLPGAPQQTLGQAAIALLKDPLQRQFRVDVETDSTIELDQTAEKQSRIEFVTAISQFLEASVQISATPAGQSMAPLLGEILLFAVRGFKVGAQLEGAIESTIEKLQAAAKNPAPPPPDPAMVKAQADADARKQEAQLEGAKMQQEGQMAQQEHQMEMQSRQAEIQADQISRQGEMAAEQQRLEVDKQKGQIELQKALIGLKTAALAASKPKTNGAQK